MLTSPFCVIVIFFDCCFSNADAFLWDDDMLFSPMEKNQTFITISVKVAQCTYFLGCLLVVFFKYVSFHTEKNSRFVKTYLSSLSFLWHSIYVKDKSYLTLDRHHVWRSHDPTSVQTFIFDKLKFAHRLIFFRIATGANYVTE